MAFEELAEGLHGIISVVFKRGGAFVGLWVDPERRVVVRPAPGDLVVLHVNKRELEALDLLDFELSGDIAHEFKHPVAEVAISMGEHNDRVESFVLHK